jgi:hypothetical protein
MEEKLAGGALKLGESTTRSPLNKTASQANSVLFSFDNTSFVSRSTTNTLLKKRVLYLFRRDIKYNNKLKK